MNDLSVEKKISLFVCPNCHTKLGKNEEILFCNLCSINFPIVNEIPVLFPKDSIFLGEKDMYSAKSYYADAAQEIEKAGLKRKFRKMLPKITKSWERDKFYKVINETLESSANPKGFQLGAGEVPTAIANKIQKVEWIHSDVDLTYKPDILADVTGLPFPDETFDLVFADNVLEHVFDLQKGVSEIQRITKVGGLIAIGIPFLYPFHGVPYDFTRLTPCGLRAAFKQTENLFLTRDSGSYVTLALLLDNRLINLFQNRTLRGGSTVLSRFLFSGFKHLDRIYKSTRHISTAASLLYVGRKINHELSNKEIMSELKVLYKNI